MWCAWGRCAGWLVRQSRQGRAGFKVRTTRWPSTVAERARSGAPTPSTTTSTVRPHSCNPLLCVCYRTEPHAATAPRDDAYDRRCALPARAPRAEVVRPPVAVRVIGVSEGGREGDGQGLTCSGRLTASLRSHTSRSDSAPTHTSRAPSARPSPSNRTRQRTGPGLLSAVRSTTRARRQHAVGEGSPSQASTLMPARSTSANARVHGADGRAAARSALWSEPEPAQPSSPVPTGSPAQLP